MFYYEHPYKPILFEDTKKIIIDDLKCLKKEVEDNLEKRFIYFDLNGKYAIVNGIVYKSKGGN